MWIRQSLFTAVDEDGTAIFLDVDDFRQHWIMIQRKGDTPKPLQKCHHYDAEKAFNDLIESQNAEERNIYFMQGATAWRY